MSTVLVIAAHPDDEVLGCGGTIAKRSSQGDDVHILIVATGATSRTRFEHGAVEALCESAEKASRAMGAASEPRMLGMPDNRLDTVARLDIVQAIEATVSLVNPDVIYTHHGGDRNIDHRIVNDAVLTAVRPQPGCTVRSILGFEVPSSTEWGNGFEPTVFEGLSDSHMLQRKAALCRYSQEMRAFPHPRSIEAMEARAKWRGASVGMPYAEAFVLLREIR